MLNLLATTEDSYRAVSIGDAAIYALLGFAVVFAGIAFLIFIVWLIGKVMVKINGVKVEKSRKSSVTSDGNVAENLAVADASPGEEISEETAAVIIAAIMAYYQKNNPKCEFTVKRIKRV